MGSIAGCILKSSKYNSSKLIGNMLSVLKLSDGEKSYVCQPWDNCSVGIVGKNSQLVNFTQDAVDNTYEILLVGEIYKKTGSNETDEYMSQLCQEDIGLSLTNTEGSFLSAIVDYKKNRIRIVNDHIASIPLFYYVGEFGIIFASEVKALLATGIVSTSISLSCFSSLLVNGWYIGQGSIIEGIDRLSYASILNIQNGQIKLEKYWQYHIKLNSKFDYEKGRKELYGHIDEAINLRTQQDKTGILLSGGYDSRGILPFLESNEINAITYAGVSESNQHVQGDCATAQMVAEFKGLSHSIYRWESTSLLKALRQSVWLAEGAAGFSYMSRWNLLAREFNIDSVLMGDECFGWARGWVSKHRIDQILGVNQLALQAGIKSIVNPAKYRELKHAYNIEKNISLAKSKGLSNIETIDNLYFEQRLANFLVPKRRLMSRLGLVVKNPFLDKKVLEFCSSLPDDARLDKSFYKRASFELDPSLFSLPIAKASDMSDYRLELKHLEQKFKISEQLIDSSKLFREYFDADAVSGFFRALATEKVNSKLLNVIQLHRSAFGMGAEISGQNLALRLIIIATLLEFIETNFSERPLIYYS